MTDCRASALVGRTAQPGHTYQEDRSTRSPSLSGRARAARGWLLAAILIVVPIESAHALTARVRWLPGTSTSSGYEVWVRRAGEPYTAALDVGIPPRDASGVHSYDVADLADGITHYFTVSAYDAASGRSPCVGELPLGDPNPCRVDACCPGSCTFGNAVDGAPCDDATTCAACAAGVCTTVAAEALATVRLRLGDTANGTRVTAAGDLPSGGAFDPSVAGMALSLIDGAGAVLVTILAPPGAVRRSRDGTSFSLDRREDDSPFRSLRVRRFSDGTARVRSRLVSAGIAPTDSLAAVGWAVRLGGRCARATGLKCVPKPRGLVCH